MLDKVPINHVYIISEETKGNLIASSRKFQMSDHEKMSSPYFCPLTTTQIFISNENRLKVGIFLWLSIDTKANFVIMKQKENIGTGFWRQKV